MIVVTTETIAGRRIVAAVGEVYGLAVRTRGVGGNIAAGFAALGLPDGDPIIEYTAALSETRDEAVAQMTLKATALGANAIVTVRFDHASAGHDMVEIVAYGTAVVVEPAP